MDIAYPVPVELFSDHSYLSELAHKDVAVWRNIFANLTPNLTQRKGVSLLLLFMFCTCAFLMPCRLTKERFAKYVCIVFAA